MNEGWISIHRQILDWQWYTDSISFRVFIHLLLKATHKPIRWKDIELLPGQMLTGRKVLANELRLSEQEIRTSLRRLKLTNEITIESTNKYSIVTICKYEFYQQGLVKCKPAEQPTIYPSNNQQLTTYNNMITKQLKKKRVFTPPSLDDFKNYFVSNGYSLELAERAFKGYDVAEWKDSEDKPVKNWKQKCQHVWFKSENKQINRKSNPSINQSAESKYKAI